LSDGQNSAKRDFYIFVLTPESIDFRSVILDTLFSENSRIITDACRDPSTESFKTFTSSLSYMYRFLIKPVEQLFSGRKLIIIPDEEIAGLPFDAFLREDPGYYQSDYEGLNYLIRKYSISFNYSSSLLLDHPLPGTISHEVISFAPEYSSNTGYEQNMTELPGSAREIKSIYRWFRGKGYRGPDATETAFWQEIQKPAILHLAMHTRSDTADSRYSSLLFSASGDHLNDGKLYNYEISLARVSSPMVVLSACNSGKGSLYHGEGLISIARGFLLAGAGSVIKTSWEVNDEVSASLITDLYRFLSKGEYKDDALRQAKLRFMKKFPPSFSHPYFWAAYEVLGSNAAVNNHRPAFILVIIVIVFACSSRVVFYLRRRKIFLEGLL
ncbi:MAG: CHAT domain-containing protein, partial [Bacteroidales bacterium]